MHTPDIHEHEQKQDHGAALADPGYASDPRRYVDINLARLHQMGMVTHDGGRTSAAEDFRIIKRPLLRNALHAGSGTANRNLIVVTSALPGEGKTYCAINLAMSIAMEKDHTVLLVDADVARPSVLKVLGLGAAPGLMDILLSEKLSVADVILKTNIDTLSLLPAGRNNKHATELLASQTMSALLVEQRQHGIDIALDPAWHTCPGATWRERGDGGGVEIVFDVDRHRMARAVSRSNHSSHHRGRIASCCRYG